MKPIDIREAERRHDLEECHITLSFPGRKESATFPALVSGLRIDRDSLPKGFYAFDIRESEQTEMPEQEMRVLVQQHRDKLNKWLGEYRGITLDEALQTIEETGTSYDLDDAFHEVIGRDLYSWLTLTANEHVLVNHDQTAVCLVPFKKLCELAGGDPSKEEPEVTVDYSPFDINEEEENLHELLRNAIK